MPILKFSVVNAPIGPQEDHGLYNDFGMTNLEREHSDISSERGEAWLPYGGGGNDHFNLEKTKLEFNDIIPVLKKVNKKPVIVCIDYDGTVTMDPNGFKGVVDKVHKAGGVCHLVTGRSKKESATVSGYCERYKINFDSLNFYPVDYDYDCTMHGHNLILDSAIGIWKAAILGKLGADVMIDDSPVCANIIAKKSPNVLILFPSLGGL